MAKARNKSDANQPRLLVLRTPSHAWSAGGRGFVQYPSGLFHVVCRLSFWRDSRPRPQIMSTDQPVNLWYEHEGNGKKGNGTCFCERHVVYARMPKMPWAGHPSRSVACEPIRLSTRDERVVVVSHEFVMGPTAPGKSCSTHLASSRRRCVQLSARLFVEIASTKELMASRNPTQLSDAASVSPTPSLDCSSPPPLDSCEGIGTP